MGGCEAMTEGGVCGRHATQVRRLLTGHAARACVAHYLRRSCARGDDFLALLGDPPPASRFDGLTGDGGRAWEGQRKRRVRRMRG